MKIQSSAIQIQKQVLAPQMQMAVKILRLPLLELEQAVNLEVEQNPFLEKQASDFEKSDKLLSDNNLENNWEQYKMFSRSPLPMNVFSDDDEFEFSGPAYLGNLEDFLNQQLAFSSLTSAQYKIAEIIIGQLNEDGYCPFTNEEICVLLGHSHSLEEIQIVRSIIQSMEPIGLGSYNLEECLVCQLSFKEHALKEQAILTVRTYLKELGHSKFQALARLLKCSLEDVQEIRCLIKSLEPKPGRRFSPSLPATYAEPDMRIIRLPSGHYKVELNRVNQPSLRIHPVYKRMMRTAHLSAKDREYLKEKFQNAIQFMKSVSLRGDTLQKLGEFILEKQWRFLEDNDASLVPLQLKDAAVFLDRNESTISRAIADKYIETPRGMFPMKFFFSQLAFSDGTSTFSNQAIKEIVQRMVESEDKEKPLSDMELQRNLAAQGIHLARRTLSKYRQALDIPPSHIRKVYQN